MYGANLYEQPCPASNNDYTFAKNSYSCIIKQTSSLALVFHYFTNQILLAIYRTGDT